MKSSFYCISILVAMVSSVLADSNPLPAFIPSPPAPEKAIVDYTVGDVFACISVSELPAHHNYYADKRYSAGLKSDWPGAKIATNIDALCQILLEAPDDTPERVIEDVTNNLRLVIRNVMDVSDIEKADALLRIVAAQSNPKKKKWAVAFASEFFTDVMDPRLLNLQKERLDDSSVAMLMVREGVPSDEISARWFARQQILKWLKEDLAITIDVAPFKVSNEADGCAALKAWLDMNAAMVEAKCAEAKAKPDRKLPHDFKRAWDARP